MDDYDRQELHFLRAYHKVISDFNRLERNIALYLRAHAETADPSSDAREERSTSFDDKLKKLNRITPNESQLPLYAKFLELANSCRTTRNHLVHGEWRFVWHLPEPIQAHSPGRDEFRASYTIEEFAKEMGIFSTANATLSELRGLSPKRRADCC